MDGQYGAATPLPLPAPQGPVGPQSGAGHTLNPHLLQALSLLNSTSGAALTYQGTLQTQALDSAQAQAQALDSTQTQPQALDSTQAQDKLCNDVNINNNLSEFLSDIPPP